MAQVQYYQNNSLAYSESEDPDSKLSSGDSEIFF